jgi:hypothetical protein
VSIAGIAIMEHTAKEQIIADKVTAAFVHGVAFAFHTGLSTRVIMSIFFKGI